jgi:hypothetical protein
MVTVSVEEQELLYSIAKNIVWELREGVERQSFAGSSKGWNVQLEEDLSTKHQRSSQKTVIHKTKSSPAETIDHNQGPTTTGANKLKSFVKKRSQSIAPVRTIKIFF